METNNKPTKNYAITIGRQFGCGGRLVGRRVAELLGINYYDKQLLYEAAKNSGLDADVFEAADERVPRFFSNLWSFNMGIGTGNFLVSDTPLSDDSVYMEQSKVMQQLVEQGPCVIVGRTADYVLRDNGLLLSVFLHAPLEDRIKTLIERGEAENATQAEKKAQKINKLRAEYYNFYTDKHWGDAASYDLSLDVTMLGIEGTAKLIADVAKSLLE